MHGWTSQILPSLESIGVWAYWIVGAAAMLEAWFVTGVVVPGTLIVDAGGALVRLGRLDFLDLIWFVAVGAALGGELGFWTGRWAGTFLRGRWDPAGSAAYRRAENLFQRRGGLALVIGRFLGPVAGLAALAAALSGMNPRQFRLWNLISAIPYAVAHVAIGYAAGDILSRIGPMLTRVALLGAMVAAALVLIWFVSVQIRRGWPLLLAGLAALRDRLLAIPTVAAWVAANPRTTAFVARRFQIGPFTGLTLTALTAIFLYLAAAWTDVALDFLFLPQVAETDQRVAQLMHAFWEPVAIRLFGLITQLGHFPVAATVLAGAVGALALTRRWASLVQLVVALGGELVTVRLLKITFARPRPELGYFLETSGSFPSGHATLAIGFYGTVFVILWRERVLGPTTALVAAAMTAFLIGFSRIYLAEHFLSDVLNGWLVGGLWLVIGVTVSEGLRERGWRPEPTSVRQRLAAASIVAVTASTAVWLTLSADPPRAAAHVPLAQVILDPAATAGTPALPLDVRTLDGREVEPVSLIIVAADLVALMTTLEAAGWSHAAPPSITSIMGATWSDWRGNLDPHAPMLPLFWDGKPQDAGLHDPTVGLDLRVWNSGAVTKGGLVVLMLALAPGENATAPWSVSMARDQVAKALSASSLQRVTRPPSEGEMLDGGKWTWDGSVVILTLP